MRVAVIGSGGREHAIVWRLHQDETVEKIFALPGSEAMAPLAELVPINWQDHGRLISFIKENRIEMVVIGPEAPLVAGLTDILEEQGVLVFGPSRLAARLEGSKIFAKDLMKKYRIPTAAYEVFSDAGAAKDYVKKVGAPIVVKADGLAAGKGVVVAQSVEEACEAIDSMLQDSLYGNAGHTVVIEEFMIGEEASLLAFTDGKTIVPMVAAQDHKRIFDGDKGPNTGGMGAYAPAPILTHELQQEAIHKILEPIIDAMAKEGAPYKGCLYAGLMITPKGVRVVEFNARFGDPETQVVLPLLKGNLSNIMKACATGCLQEEMVKWDNSSAACVIMASKGYPESSHKGDLIEGDLSMKENDWVFHSGTLRQGENYITNGGRVIGITARALTLEAALQNVYERVTSITFEGMQFRKDIGQKGLKNRKN